MKLYYKKIHNIIFGQLNNTYLSGCFIVILISGCAGYAVTLNEQPVYQPKQLLAVSGLSDAQFSNCVQQTIEDKKITKIADLHILICTSAGIEMLTGIDQFKSLNRISFASNNLADITILGKLENLIELNIEAFEFGYKYNM